MIREFAKVTPAGEILARALLDEDTVPDPADLAPGKPFWLRVEREDAPTINAAVEALDGPTDAIDVEAGRVLVSYDVRAKTGEEVEALRAVKGLMVKAAFIARAYAPIEHSVGGQAHTFDADKDAIENLTGVTTLINAGALTTPRPWKTQDGPVTMQPADFLGLVGAMAARKDALYAAKWAMEAELAGLDTAADVAAFDPEAGWDA